MSIITLTFNITWLIEGYDDYVFIENKILVNQKRGTIIRQVINGGSIGYCLNGKFISLTKLKPLLKKPKKEQCPF
jgi:hypothetical protein